VAAAAAAFSAEMARSFRGLVCGLEGRPCGCLARHGTDSRYPGHDELHLQLGSLCAELAHFVGASPT
jgi:hypothetical protein